MKTTEVIEYYREKHHMTLRSLGELIGVSKQRLHYIINGHGDFKELHTIKKISHFLNIPVEELRDALIYDFAQRLIDDWKKK